MKPQQKKGIGFGRRPAPAGRGREPGARAPGGRRRRGALIRTTIAIDGDTFAAAVVQAEREGATLSAWARALLALATTDRRLAARVRRRIERERRGARSAVKRSRR